MPPGILVSSPDMDACKQEKRREKVTELSWEEQGESLRFTAADQLRQGKYLP